MPKQTFFNLPNDKKNMLIHALQKEFSRVPLSKASITNIVKTAGIPRGSFYQYFDGKEDCFFFLLNELAKKRRENFIKILKENDGDLFTSMAEIYRLMLEKMAGEDSQSFLRNTFLNMTYEIKHIIVQIFSDWDDVEQYQRISLLIKKQNLNLSDGTKLYHIMQILTAVISHNFVEKFAKELSDQEAIELFMCEIQLLKKGLAIGQ